MVRALYAFSGDPITYGHIDIIKRAALAFEEVVVGIGANPEKRYLFSIDERAEMATRSLIGLRNVRVTSFAGMLTDFAYEQRIPVVVKGVRNAADVEYERVLHQVGESQRLGIETFVLFARPELAHISSSTVKAIQKEQGLIYDYVPPYVKQCLEARLSGQYLVGVTGEMGAGKSFIGEQFCDLGRQRGIAVHNVEMDRIGHDILGTLQDPAYCAVRATIAEAFGNALRLPDGSIDRKALGEIVFADPAKLSQLNKTMYDAIIVRLRRELHGKRGLFLLNAALLAETDMTHLCNHNVVLINVDRQTQQQRLEGRGMDAPQIERRLATQYTAEQKAGKIRHRMITEGNGHLWHIGNSADADTEGIARTFDTVVEELNVR